jgi:hypothetical protein
MNDIPLSCRRNNRAAERPHLRFHLRFQRGFSGAEVSGQRDGRGAPRPS